MFLFLFSVFKIFRISYFGFLVLVLILYMFNFFECRACCVSGMALSEGGFVFNARLVYFVSGQFFSIRISNKLCLSILYFYFIFFKYTQTHTERFSLSQADTPVVLTLPFKVLSAGYTHIPESEFLFLPIPKLLRLRRAQATVGICGISIYVR